MLEHTFEILKGNPLGDPHVRKLAVWLPPQYDEGRRRRFPVPWPFGGSVSGSSPVDADTGLANDLSSLVLPREGKIFIPGCRMTAPPNVIVVAAHVARDNR